MKNLQTFVIALPLLIVSSLASAVSVSGNIALTSDYIWRGWTQSAGGPAVSGGFDLSTDSGFYIGTWGSSVQFGDAATSDLTELELDVYLGYSTDIADNIARASFAPTPFIFNNDLNNDLSLKFSNPYRVCEFSVI